MQTFLDATPMTKEKMIAAIVMALPIFGKREECCDSGH
jgi:hypothetical protein